MKKVYLLFSLFFCLFLVNQVLNQLSIPRPVWMSSYLNDFLCMPIILSICLFLIQHFSRYKQIRISLFTAFSLALVYSIYFELYLPKVSSRYTADAIDAILYFTGSLLFVILQEPAPKKTSDIGEGSKQK